MDNFAVMLVVFAVGLLVGLALSLALSPARRQQKRLQQERDEAVHNLTRYRDQVDQHFLKTAELVNQLTASYRSVHEHLSGGARQLCSEEGRRQAVTRSLDRPPEEDTGADTEAPTGPPLDYAPSARGTLSEDFGLRREYDAEGPFTPVDDLLAERARKEAEPPQENVEPPRDYAEDDGEPGLSTGEDEPRKV